MNKIKECADKAPAEDQEEAAPLQGSVSISEYDMREQPTALVGPASPEIPLSWYQQEELLVLPLSCMKSLAEAQGRIYHLLSWSMTEQPRQNKQRKSRNKGQERQGRIVPRVVHPPPSVSSKLLKPLPMCLKTDPYQVHSVRLTMSMFSIQHKHQQPCGSNSALQRDAGMCLPLLP